MKKGRKQVEHLFCVGTQSKSISCDLMDSHAVFVDGGSQSNPQFNPTIRQNSKSKKKNRIIISIRKGELDIVNHHLHHISKGLLLRPPLASASVNYLLPPRKDVPTTNASLKNPKNNKNLWHALSAVEEAQRKGTSKGAAKQVITDKENKYFCVGTQTVRAGTGTRPIHYSLQAVLEERSLRILKLFKAVEHLYEAWMDTKEIWIINAAINLVKPSTFQIERTNQDLKTTGITTRMYGALETGLNVYLNTHTDKDFTFSAFMLCTKGKYAVNDNVVAYSCFPGLGIGVPLRPGDV